MNCDFCGEERPIAARGLCRTCYSRWQRNGKLEPLKAKRGTCSVEGCESKAHGQGLCSKHLQRLRKRGTVDAGRTYPQKTGLLSQHELYAQWTEFRRAKNARPVVQAWKEDFAQFVLDVGGGRPSRRHRLYPLDRGAPMGPGNFEWREALIEKQPDESDADYDKRHRLARRELNGIGSWDGDLRRKYGKDFGIPQLREMAEAQGHRCAICGEPEREQRNGIVRHLAVDHDHATGLVRQLLCQSCNTGLGKFKDDPELLAKAIAYLVKHAKQ